ncbi:MAG: carboxypeptidase regulatory-like domain-containing protein, partial [Thiotrichaceae bacterium]|nr:carboxypeptidase regulatory-like domain-containing protein [Thiotrichaceae bacterium]
ATCQEDGNGVRKCTLPNLLNYGETYQWEIIVNDGIGGDVKQTSMFTTLVNLPPSPLDNNSFTFKQDGLDVSTDAIDSTKDVAITWTPSTDNVDKVDDTVQYKVNLICGSNNIDVYSGSEALCNIQASQLDFEQGCRLVVEASDGVNIIDNKAPPLLLYTLENRSPLSFDPIYPTGTDEISPEDDLVLKWEQTSDPDGDTITYDVYFNDLTIPVAHCSNLTQQQVTAGCTIAAANIQSNVPSYHWEVRAKDSYGNTTKGNGATWTAKIKQNSLPSKPEGLTLLNDGVEVVNDTLVKTTEEVKFQWNPSADADSDALTYYVNVQEQGTTGSVSYETTDTTQLADLNKLEVDTSYDWWVVADDGKGGKTESDRMSFKTDKAGIPDFELKANSGKEFTMLKWGEGKALSGVDEYQILRVKADPKNLSEPSFASAVVVNTVSNSTFNYEDNDELQLWNEADGDGYYCYKVVALDNDGDAGYGKGEVARSIYSKEKSCVKHGTVVFEIEDTYGTESGEAKINMPNGGDLVIGSSNFCFSYNNDVISVDETAYVNKGFEKGIISTSFLGNYGSFVPQIYPDAVAVEDEDENEVKLSIITVSIENFNPEQAENHDTLSAQGGTLMRIAFKIADDTSVAQTPISWFVYKEGSHGIDNKDRFGECIAIADEDGPIESISLRGGTYYRQDRRRLVRNGDKEVKGTAHFYIQEPYSKGDTNGDGRITNRDVDEAIKIGMGSKQYSAEIMDKMLSASDFNGDGKIDATDARIIRYYINNDTWLDNLLPSTDNMRRKLRDSRDDTLTLSIGQFEATTDSIIEIPLLAEGISELTAANLSVGYNKNVVEKIKVYNSGLTSDKGNVRVNYDDQEGLVRISIMTETPIEGSGEFVKLKVYLKAETTVKSSALVIGRTDFYDEFNRNFETSVLERTITKQKGQMTLTDVEEPVIEEHGKVISEDEIIKGTPEITTGAYNISGRLTTAQGKPVANATVQAGDKTVTTDNSGYWTIVDIHQGNYTITATKAGYIFESQTCTVAEGQNCAVTLKANANDADTFGKYAAYGTVTDQNGDVVDNVTVTFNGQAVSLDSTGYWARIGLTAGTYPVIATMDGRVVAEQQCTIVEDGDGCEANLSVLTEDDDDIVVPDPLPEPVVGDFQATITVLDKAGQGLADTTIEVSGESIATETYMTDANGQINVPELFEGEYTASLLTALDYVYEAKTFKVSSNTKHATVYLKPSAPKFTVKTQWTPTKVYEGDTSGILYQPIITNNGE